VTEKMTSSQRVLAAAAGRPTDRVPVMYWLNPHMACRLMSEYKPCSNRVANNIGRMLWRRLMREGMFEAGEWTRGLPLLMEEVANLAYAQDLGADIALAKADFTRPSTFLNSIKKIDGRLTFRGNFNILYALGGMYADPIEPVISDSRALRTLPIPPVQREQFEALRKQRQKNPSACFMVEVTSLNQFLMGFIMTMPDYLMALHDDPDSIKIGLARITDWVAEIIRYAVEAGAEMVFLQDDYGTTGRPIMSMKMWESMIYPNLKHLIDATHAAGVPFMLHSCGYQMPFLDYYIDAGLDVLQSFQPKAGNDFKAAYEQYGDRLTFATGIDIQRGETMTPQELRDEIVHNYQLTRCNGASS